MVPLSSWHLDGSTCALEISLAVTPGSALLIRLCEMADYGDVMEMIMESIKTECKSKMERNSETMGGCLAEPPQASVCVPPLSCPVIENHQRSLTFDIQNYTDTRVCLVGARAMKTSAADDIISIQVNLNQSPVTWRLWRCLNPLVGRVFKSALPSPPTHMMERTDLSLWQQCMIPDFKPNPCRFIAAFFSVHPLLPLR